MGKNKVTTGVFGENESFERDPKTMKSRKNSKTRKLKSMKLEEKKEEIKKPGWILSSLNHAQSLKYGNQEIMVPARCRRGQLRINDVSKLEKMKGISVVDIVGKNAIKK